MRAHEHDDGEDRVRRECGYEGALDVEPVLGEDEDGVGGYSGGEEGGERGGDVGGVFGGDNEEVVGF